MPELSRFAGNPCDEARVIEAKPLKGGMLLLLFSSGEKKLFDALSVEGSVFLPLRERRYSTPFPFNMASFHGATVQ